MRNSSQYIVSGLYTGEYTEEMCHYVKHSQTHQPHEEVKDFLLPKREETEVSRQS